MCCGGLLFFARGSSTETLALRTWGLSMLLGALGLATVMAGGLADALGVALGNAMLLAARAMAWNGARRFNEKKAALWLAMLGPLLWVATIPLQHSLRWMSLACVIGAVYTLATIYEVARGRADALPSRMPLLVVLLIHAGFYMVRSIGALWGWDQGPLAHIVVQVVIAEGMIHIVTVSVLLLCLAKERVEALAVQQMRNLAMLDSLTGVGNRRQFDEQIEMELRRADRQEMCLSLLLIDVDHFKAFNDAFGHQRGDTCLRAVAEAIGTCIRRPSDLVTRYGGEEFAVLLPHTDRSGAMEVAESIRAAIGALAVATPAGPGYITVSIGVASSTPGRNPTASGMLLAEADEALYLAKHSGRDVVRSRGHADVAETVGGG